jgi:poly-gamma-glutamate capsule biosynthesis protein CapA/YwtB (metallophosphatase superfamily)
MPQTLFLTGDVNLMKITDPGVPFRLVAPMFKQAAVVFSNLESCFYDPPGDYDVIGTEGFYAPPGPGGEALKVGGIQAVGNANNVNYGEAAIKASNKRLDEVGIAHCGSGNNLAEASKPVIIERNGVRFGFLQRTSVYWPKNHEATRKLTGVAVIRAHTAYQLPLHSSPPGIPTCNRPGVPPIILTWADPDYLARFKEDVAALRKQADIVVASCHWGLVGEVLAYMTEIAHAAIDAGADIVMGHGPPVSLPVGVYKGKAIFYGLGCFSFHTGHGGKKFGDWLGMMVRATVENKQISRVAFQFVRHNELNETVLRSVADETQTMEDIAARSSKEGAHCAVAGSEAIVSA